MNDKIKMIINIVGFYIGWWGCILGSSNGLPYIGPLLMLLFIIFHGAFFVKDYKDYERSSRINMNYSPLLGLNMSLKKNISLLDSLKNDKKIYGF